MIDVINIISMLCIISMCGLIAMVINAIVKNKNIIEYIGKFKKGHCMAIYFISLPLYVLAHMSEYSTLLRAFFAAVKSSVELVVLKYDISCCIALMDEYILYNIAMNMCFALVLINAILFIFAVVGEKAIIAIKLKLLFFKDDNALIIVGYNKNNIKIAESVKTKTILISNMSQDELKYLYRNNILYNNSKNSNLSGVLSKFKNLKKRKVTVIINTEKNSDNLVYANDVLNFINSSVNTQSDFFNDCLECYVFCGTENKSLFYEIEDKSCGLITIVNKYSIVANNLCFEYPITRYLTENQVDRSSGAIKDNVEINHCFLGFGNMSRHIFDVSFSNNQMLKSDYGNIMPMLVNYHIFDTVNVFDNIEHNHTYKRYEKEMEKLRGSGDYYPVIDKVANVNFCEINLNNIDFYNKIKDCLRPNKNDLNIVTIALGEDVLNVDIFEKLNDKSQEWGVKIQFYVKVDSQDMADAVMSVLNQKGLENVVLYGMLGKIYTFENIAKNKLEHMQIDRHMLYMANSNPGVEEDELRKIAAKQWHENYNRVKRVSNKYALLNLRTKLNLLGFDITKEDKNAVSCAKELQAVLESKECIGKTEYSTRDMMAMQEHTRWNSFMIGNGYIPASKKEYFYNYQNTDIAKDELLKVRKHINITTFEGLKEFAHDSVKILNKTYEEADVIKYDYDVLDNYSDIIEKIGYKITKLQ